MKQLLILLMPAFFISAYSQTVHVVYDVKVDVGGMQSKPFNHRYELTNSQGKSAQKKFLAEAGRGKGVNKNSESTRVVKIGNDTTYVYKDFAANRLVSEEKIFTKPFVVADELNIFSWQIQTDTLTVLDHKCRKATTTFRGREYAAYFAEDIPVPDGPAKFNGLPGLVLKVMIIDRQAVYSIEAVALRFDQSANEIKDPFAERKAISFTDFKKEYNDKYAELQAFSAEQGGGVTIKKGGLELLSDD